VHPPGREHDQHAVATGDRAPDDLTVVGRPRADGDAVAEAVQLVNALLPADSDDLVPAVERVLGHVLPELADDADLHRFLLAGRS